MENPIEKLSNINYVDSIKFNDIIETGNLNDIINICKSNYVKKTNKYACVTAARHNYLNILKWLHNNGFKWDEETFYAAAMGGNIEILKYLREEQCPYDIMELYTYTVSSSEDHIDTLQYFYDSNYLVKENIFILENDYICNRDKTEHIKNTISIYKKCLQSNCGCLGELGFYELPCNMVAYKGNINSLEWLHKHGFSWNEETCIAASVGNQLEILKYLYENGCPWNEDLCRHAAASGHLEILKYALENGCSCDDRTYASAERHGHFKIMEYLKLNGLKFY